MKLRSNDDITGLIAGKKLRATPPKKKNNLVGKIATGLALASPLLCLPGYVALEQQYGDSIRSAVSSYFKAPTQDVPIGQKVYQMRENSDFYKSFFDGDYFQSLKPSEQVGEISKQFDIFTKNYK